MLAVDTNVVVRFLTGDEPAQAARAHVIFQRETVLLVKTVLLETQWVLRSLYRFDPVRIIDALASLIALPNVVCEDMESVANAIEWVRHGMDFADALHLAAARPAARFATFDRKLIESARNITDITPVQALRRRLSAGHGAAQAGR
jgi:predicted nucleic-acid-binding protein